MSLRSRVRRLADRFGQPPEPRPELSGEERSKRLASWISGQTYNRGIFDADSEFRPAWSRYQSLWSAHNCGRSPPTAVWIKGRQPDFEEARRRVVEIMVRVLRLQPSPVRVLAKVLGRTIPEPSVP
jgi:hypothetical protein